MKILYFGHTNKEVNKRILKREWDSDNDVEYALKLLGHEVVSFDDREFDIKELLEKGKEVDLFLFHKGGIFGGLAQDFWLSLNRLQIILSNLKCKKVFWYVDKVWGDRFIWMENIIPMVDYGFLVDETFIRRHKYRNLHPLRQGCSDKFKKLGEFKKEYESDIAFAGMVYGGRREFIKFLNEVYGDRFKVWNNVWNQDLYDLCQSVKIIVAPYYFTDDFYWSARIYMTLAGGGFLIHPRLYGLKKFDGLEENKHYIAYSDVKELKEKIDYFLLNPKADKQREEIVKAGREYTLKNLKYSDRLKRMFEIIEK